MKEQIISFLEGPRDYSQGVALYEQFGPNRMLKAKFRQLGECEMTRGTLIEELRKLSGMSEAEFAGIFRRRQNSLSAPSLSGCMRTTCLSPLPHAWG